MGGLTPRDALRGPALAALPTVAAWEHELETAGERERESVLAVADRVEALGLLRGRIDDFCAAAGEPPVVG